MPPERNLDDEEGRLRALGRLEVLDTVEEEAFEKIVELVRQVLRVPMSAVSLIDRRRQWFKARRGLAATETPREISFCTYAIAQSGPFMVSDALADERFATSPLVVSDPFVRSYLGIPLTMPDGYTVGSLCAMDTRPRVFAADEIQILQNLAAIVVGELQLRRIATTDALSGALTRRAWLERATSEWSRSERHDRPISLAILDLDHFKAINDAHGHPQGDRVIRAFAQVCRNELRESDLFGRLGGEEFAILLPETSRRDAFCVLERVRDTFARADLRHEGEAISATVSIGVSDREGGAASLDALMKAADAALYRAKFLGRNTVNTAHEED